MCSTKHSERSCTVVTVNSGSTSVKLAAFEAHGPGSVTQISHDHLSGEKLVPQEVLSGFLNPAGEAQGRPVGVAIDKKGALLVADDVGNAVWRVTKR